MVQRVEPMEAEEWETLVGRPEWKKLRKFLLDYRQRTMEEWADGQFQRDVQAERDNQTTDACVRCQVYMDLASLEYKDIAEFYFNPEDSNDEEDEDADDS